MIGLSDYPVKSLSYRISNLSVCQYRPASGAMSRGATSSLGFYL